MAVALVSGLVAGGIGGVIGHRLADAPPVRSALERPVVGNQLVDLPAGSVAQVAQAVLPSVVKLQTKMGQGSAPEAVW